MSTEHPNNPRLQKERERDRGLRPSSEIRIETYTNCLWQDSIEQQSTEMSLSEKQKQTTAFPQRLREMPTSSSSRETTPLEEGQCASELPREIGFFSGNPSVEVTNGIIHLYKKK